MPNKKQMVIDAVGVMFNQANTPVTIRLAQAGDKVIESTASISTPVQIEEPKKEQIKTESKVNATEEITDSKEIERIESDQEKMVLDLFDGKYVE